MKKMLSSFADKLLSKQQMKNVKGGCSVYGLTTNSSGGTDWTLDSNACSYAEAQSWAIYMNGLSQQYWGGEVEFVLVDC